MFLARSMLACERKFEEERREWEGRLVACERGSEEERREWEERLRAMEREYQAGMVQLEHTWSEWPLARPRARKHSRACDSSPSRVRFASAQTAPDLPASSLATP